MSRDTLPSVRLHLVSSTRSLNQIGEISPFLGGIKRISFIMSLTPLGSAFWPYLRGGGLALISF